MVLRKHHTRVIDLFRALDRNQDGHVSREELGAALTSLGVHASVAEADALFAKLDPDGSQSIEFKELQVRDPATPAP